MKDLEKTFVGRGDVKGFQFTQLAANSRAYLYQVITPGGGVHFEAFKKTVTKARQYSHCGMVYDLPDMILYPKAKSFGLWAFSYLSLENAYKNFLRLSDSGTARSSLISDLKMEYNQLMDIQKVIDKQSKKIICQKEDAERGPGDQPAAETREL